MFLEIDRIISTRFCVRKIKAVLGAVILSVLVLTFYDLDLVFSVIRNPSRLDDSSHYMYGELFNSRRRFV